MFGSVFEVFFVRYGILCVGCRRRCMCSEWSGIKVDCLGNDVRDFFM